MTALESHVGGTFGLLYLLLLLPFASAGLLLLSGKRSAAWGHLLATGVALATFGVSLALFLELRGLEHPVASQHLFSWIPVGDFHVDLDLVLDPLSSVFTLLITGVGSLVHLYSIGYMEHDEGRKRFFAYLNLFLGSMLLLVLASSFVSLYVGWELVGLSSYLLIGFWFTKPSAATAAKKAFIANRVGDVGLGLAIMLIFSTLGSVDIAEVLERSSAMTTGTATAIALLLLLAACGKSAQVPLHVWLPDAMEGPTPASALIHAATMVTAGVYLVARANPIFTHSPVALDFVAWVGVVTVLVGGIIACAQDDLKKVLAYSTISQIGYMFVGVALVPAAGIFHLLTHGFFKALMFLGAGSVMHGLHDETNMRRMGGLIRSMPVTAWTFLVGWLAIIGFPGLGGFFSKDQILEAAFHDESYLLWSLALLGAGITAFYMSRLVFMTFLGPSRVSPDVHPHESPRTMTVPLVVLAAASAVGGFLLNATTEGRLFRWLAPVFEHEGGEHAAAHEAALPAWSLTVITLAVVAAGVGFAYSRYLARPVPETAPSMVAAPVVWARKKLYFDTVYESVLMRPGQYLARFLVFVDGRGIDGAVNTVAAVVGGSSGRLRRLQTGYVRSYALGMLGGAALLAGAFLLVRL